jgi:hypothetical protein
LALPDKIAVGDRLAGFEGAGGEEFDLTPNLWMGEVGRVDRDTEERVGMQRPEEVEIPEEADVLTQRAADAPAEGLGIVDVAGGEMGDRFETSRICEAEIAGGVFARRAEEPCWSDEAGGEDAGALGEIVAATGEEGAGVVEGEVEELAFAGGVGAGEETGAGGLVGMALALMKVTVEDGLVAGGDEGAQPGGECGIGCDIAAMMMIRDDEDGDARDADGGETGEDGGDGIAGEGGDVVDADDEGAGGHLPMKEERMTK